MTYCYFVSFHANTFGNASVLLNHKIETYRDVNKVENMLETQLNVEKVTIINWKRIYVDTLR